MYTLYFSKEEKEIKISKARKALMNLNYTEEVTQYNDNYFLCLNRKPLVEKAKIIHQAWILELEEEMKIIKELKF